MKGSTFLSVNHTQTSAEQTAQAISVSLDSSAVIKALKELTDAVKAIKPEVRVDLPAMTPVVQPGPTPIVVNVPEFPAIPPNPAVSVTVPDFPQTQPTQVIIHTPKQLLLVGAFSVFALADFALRLWEILKR